MKIRKVLLAIACFLLTLSIGVISNAETVIRDVDVEVNYDAETKPTVIEFIITLKNGAVLLGDINGDGYVNESDCGILSKFLENNVVTREEFDEEFGTDATRAEQAADIANRRAFIENGTIVINESDLNELKDWYNELGYHFGMNTIGTLKGYEKKHERVTEDVSAGETKYKITVTCDSVPQTIQTIGIDIQPGAIGYVGDEPYANENHLEYTYSIGQEPKDTSIILSDGVRNGNKVVFDIIAPDKTGFRGDANEDTKVDSTDSDLIAEYGGEYKVEINPILADYNLDEVVNVADSNEILKIKNYEPIELDGTLASQSSYKIIKNDNGKYSIEVTIPENATEGTIEVKVKEAMLMTPEKKVNSTITKSFKVVVEEENDKEDKTTFKVTNKKEEKQSDGKTIVTITVNKELNSDKLPTGWLLSKDKKSISKTMKAGATEQITLTAKDGTELKYSVEIAKEETLKKVKFNNHEYYIFEKNMTWKDAKAFCEKQGGYLVTITSKEEQQFIEKMIKDSNGSDKRFWIGATDSINGKWGWITGEKYDYTNWGENQPDLKEQLYAAIHGYEVTYLTGNVKSLVKSGEWDNLKNDGDSNMSNIYFICEWGDVAADKGSEQLPSKLPQAGLGTTLTFAVVVVAGIALISLKKYRDYKDIK